MTGRGAYAKGVAKREEILERGLDVVAREGYRGASVKQIADAVGLSQAGLLHYFDSKEELFTAILRKRDQLDRGLLEPDESPGDIAALREGYLRLIRRNSERAGAVLLFSRMAVDAADGDHPAREFFRERAETMREIFATAIADAQAAGTVDPALDPEAVARIVQAVSDGLQLQWLQDPAVDMIATIDALFDALGVKPRTEAPA